MTRTLRPPEAIVPPNIQYAIEANWCAGTSYDPTEWSMRNPARGQCAVTALVLQDYMGGEIIRHRTIYKGRVESHFSNVLADGRTYDLTARQYPPGQPLVEAPIHLVKHPTNREKILAFSDTRHKYELFSQLVQLTLSSEIVH